jgi:hypothetical protein
MTRGWDARQVARVGLVTVTIAGTGWSLLGCSLFVDLDALRPLPAETFAGCFEEPDPGGPNPPRDWIVLMAESRGTLSGCHRDERTNVDNSLAYTVALEEEAFGAERPTANVTYTRNSIDGPVELPGGTATWDLGDPGPEDDTLTLVRPDEDPDREAATVFMERCNPDHTCSELGLAVLTSPGAIMDGMSTGSSVLRLFSPPLPTASPPPSPRDPRFFGTYCELGPRKFCKDVRVRVGPFSFPVRRKCVTVTDVQIRIRHVDSPGGGLLHGGGTFAADGEAGMVAVAGLVTKQGSARVSARIPQVGNEMGTMWLTSDGHRASIAAHGEQMTISKKTCGNRTPVVSVSTMTGFSDHLRGRACFTGRVVDDEDAAFPLSRMSFSSSRDGSLPGATAVDARSARVCARKLSNGRHHVTFSATDSNGLRGEATVELVSGAVVTPVE